MNSNITDKFALYNGDCVEVTKQIPDRSVGFEIFSPPFANLYIYSDDLRDMGNCKNTEEFFTQMDYLTPELYRVLKCEQINIQKCNLKEDTHFCKNCAEKQSALIDYELLKFKTNILQEKGVRRCQQEKRS